MRTAWFDCFSGAAGDMILATLVDAGWPAAELAALVRQLDLPGVQTTAERVTRGGIAATYVRVDIAPEGRAKHRHLPEILHIIDAAGLAPIVAERAKRVFTRLASAEATVHNCPIEQVHFHEVGAADAIVDIVGTCVGIAALGIERIICSPLVTGTGTVHCAHGELPVPAPATAALLRGVPVATCDEVGELLTPTGAALLTTLADDFGPLPAMRIEHIGYGAGTRENRARPNVLRLMIGEAAAGLATSGEQVVLLETQLDDAPGQNVAYACERLLEAGALDAYIVPIIMKKGRPGQLLTVLCQPQDAPALERWLLRETPTLGVRRRTCQREALPRHQEQVDTPYGAVRVKVAGLPNETRRAWPEYEDCAALAREQDVPLAHVQQAALDAWRQLEHTRHAGDR